MTDERVAEHWHPMHRDQEPRRVQRLLAERYPDVDADAMAIEIWTGEISRQVQAGLLRFLPSAGIDESELAVLTALHQADPAQPTAAALARELVITSGGMAKVLARLERRGLIERHARPEDARTMSVGLTADGSRLIEELSSVDHEAGIGPVLRPRPGPAAARGRQPRARRPSTAGRSGHRAARWWLT